jgi:hypothetical protein
MLRRSRSQRVAGSSNSHIPQLRAQLTIIHPGFAVHSLRAADSAQYGFRSTQAPSRPSPVLAGTYGLAAMPASLTA